ATALEQGLGVLAQTTGLLHGDTQTLCFHLLDFLLVKNEKTLGSGCFRGFMNLAVLLEVTS
ncbi:MAG: hypothetical protein ACRC9Y_05650, partial [Aeromonas veronii]